MELANFVTKLQDVLRPKQEEIETSNYQKGKRIMLPAKDVERVYRYQRKQVVRVTYTGPTKIACRYCGTPFLSLSDAEVAIRNIIPMRVSKKRIGNEFRKSGQGSDEMGQGVA